MWQAHHVKMPTLKERQMLRPVILCKEFVTKSHTKPHRHTHMVYPDTHGTHTHIHGHTHTHTHMHTHAHTHTAHTHKPICAHIQTHSTFNTLHTSSIQVKLDSRPSNGSVLGSQE